MAKQNPSQCSLLFVSEAHWCPHEVVTSAKTEFFSPVAQARLARKEEEMDHARTLLEQARHDAETHAREAEEATLEARVLRDDLGESRGALSAREAKAKATEEAVKVRSRGEGDGFCILMVAYICCCGCCSCCSLDCRVCCLHPFLSLFQEPVIHSGSPFDSHQEGSREKVPHNLCCCCRSCDSRL